MVGIQDDGSGKNAGIIELMSSTGQRNDVQVRHGATCQTITGPYELHIKRVIDHRLTMGIAHGSVFVDGERIYEAKDLRTVMTVSA